MRTDFHIQIKKRFFIWVNIYPYAVNISIKPMQGTHSLENFSRNSLMHSKSKPTHLLAASISLVAQLIRQSTHPEEGGKHIFLAAISVKTSIAFAISVNSLFMPETSIAFPAVETATMKADKANKEKQTFPMVAILMNLFSCLLICLGHQSNVKCAMTKVFASLPYLAYIRLAQLYMTPLYQFKSMSGNTRIWLELLQKLCQR